MPKELITKQKEFMKTTITIKVVKDSDSSTVKILDAIEEAYGEFDRIVKKYTRFNENSELSNLNRQNGKWVEVSKEFFQLIEKMLDLAKKSNGAFDPTIIDFLDVYGYNKNYDFSKLENPELDIIVKNTLETRPSWKEIKLDKKISKVKLQKNQRLDLGGIGKGYAIDCAFEKLSKAGLNNFLIDGGGDIRASGTNEESKPWKVGLKTIDTEGKEAVNLAIELNNQAVAGSGSWARKVKQFHHLINPATGKPHEPKFNSVYVMAKDATTADGWATAIFVLGGNLSDEIKSSEEISFLTL